MYGKNTHHRFNLLNRYCNIEKQFHTFDSIQIKQLINENNSIKVMNNKYVLNLSTLYIKAR